MMKRPATIITLSVAAMLMSILLTGQSTVAVEIDQEIVSGHFIHYPEATNLTWKKLITSNNEIHYLSNFEFQGKSYCALYNTEGSLIKESSMQNAVPKSIKSDLAIRYGNYQLKKFVQIRDFENSSVNYNVSIAHAGGKEITLTYDKAHSLVQDLSMAYAMGD